MFSVTHYSFYEFTYPANVIFVLSFFFAPLKSYSSFKTFWYSQEVTYFELIRHCAKSISKL